MFVDFTFSSIETEFNDHSNQSVQFSGDILI